jgi:hypothetical protein
LRFIPLSPPESVLHYCCAHSSHAVVYSYVNVPVQFYKNSSMEMQVRNGSHSQQGRTYETTSTGVHILQVFMIWSSVLHGNSQLLQFEFVPSLVQLKSLCRPIFMLLISDFKARYSKRSICWKKSLEKSSSSRKIIARACRWCLSSDDANLTQYSSGLYRADHHVVSQSTFITLVYHKSMLVDTTSI